MHLFTMKPARHTITYRLKDLEARLDPARFVRLGRGNVASLDAIVKVNAMPGGTHVAVMKNGQKLQISRIQSRRLRARLFKLYLIAHNRLDGSGHHTGHGAGTDLAAAAGDGPPPSSGESRARPKPAGLRTHALVALAPGCSPSSGWR